MMRLRRQMQEKHKMAEECCFVCKDSGHDLRVCGSRNCLKSYHPGCVRNKDEGFICDWHICVECRGRSDYQCLCCPLQSVCCACLRKVEFVQLMRKQNKGFCSTCLNLAIAIEKNDPQVAKTDNYEILFRDYWEGIKDVEHLTLVDLEEASDILNRKLNCKEGANLERFAADDHKSDENTPPDNGANDQTIPFDSKCKQIKANTSQKNKSNKRTYVGWGSKELIGFLSSFGKDTSKPLDEHEIIGVVKGYIKEKKLYKDGKKLSFLCDDKLQPLFTRRKVRCQSIRKFLRDHQASNAVSEDESFCSYEDDDDDDDDDDDSPVIKKRPLNSLEPKIAKKVSERSKRHFASLTQNNINLIYLRRTLVVNLLSQPDTFEQKVVGCFVRVKYDKNACSYEIPKKAFVLGQVTGIKKSNKEYIINDTCTNILLCVTGYLDDVSISMLSDEDLEEDECDDLISLAEKGLLKRATVAELEEKVAIVHADIVSHWIDRELQRLPRKIEFASMKGLQVLKEKLLHQEKLLKTPAERQRRLEEVPEIVPDTEYTEKETELQVAASNSSQENRGAAHQVVVSLSVLNGEPSEVVSKQGDPPTRGESGPGVDWSFVNSDGSEEKRDTGETLSVRTSPKRGAQWSSETSEPKKPRLSEERALPEAKFADHSRPLELVYRQEPPAGLSFAEPPNEGPQEKALPLRHHRSTVSPLAVIGPSPPPRQEPVWHEGEEGAGVMPLQREAKAAETGGSAPSPGAEDTYTDAETGEPVVAPSASCLDNMDVEARPSPCPWSVAEAEEDGLEPQEEVAATGDVCDGPPPEPWAEPAQVSSPRADETIVPAPELVAGPSSGPAWLVATQSRTLSACPSSRALVRVPDHPTDHPDLDDETGLDAWLRAANEADLDAWLRVANSRKRALEALQDHDYDVVALGARLQESSAAKSQALREQHAALQLERRRREELSAELASAERALREARSEAEGHQAEASRTEQRAQAWSMELADVRRQLEDAQAQRHAASEHVGRLERERDSAAQAAETARQAAVEESARLVAQLEELRRGKAAAAQESARMVEALKRQKLHAEAARERSERARQVSEAGLTGCKKLISRLERQFCESVEERRKLQPKLEGIQQLSQEACDSNRKDIGSRSRVITRQIHQLQQVTGTRNCVDKDGVTTRAMRRRWSDA